MAVTIIFPAGLRTEKRSFVSGRTEIPQSPIPTQFIEAKTSVKVTPKVLKAILAARREGQAGEFKATLLDQGAPRSRTGQAVHKRPYSSKVTVRLSSATAAPN